ncbi:Glycosyltransferase [Melia azedarach]|uniref:Glycosyltransferase n=1 Tax=Melia azedarach TaxID=155640 RepID=A0ACC1XXN7_MELAZ|nr:Glycosyltransferase [Melia azedarach]
MQSTKPHAILLASPGMGHFFPVLELGKRFVTQHDFQVTIFVVATDTSTVQSQLCDLPNPNRFNIVSLPPVDISGLVDQDASIVTKIIVMMRESLPALRSAISAMKPRPTALFADLFGTEALVIADEFEMLKYVFIASNARFLAATIYFPTIDKKLEEEHINEKQPLMIPGCRPVRFQDTLEAFLDPKDQVYVEYLRVGLEIPTGDGILVNTWEDLEPTTLCSMRDTRMLGRVGKVPVYPIGPMVRPVKTSAMEKESSVLEWLDMQPTESVIYVSFGSGGTLSAKQMIELAWGLELSQQRFIWVVRPPMDDDVSGSYFNVSNGSDGTPDYLPDGFLTRNAKMGLVVPMWAQQREILGHTSVGGFLTHCGWNSTLESIVNGVPMIAWPLYAEQKMNATMLTEEIGVAVRPKELPTESIIGREEIEMMVRKIMVDKAIRTRAKQLKHSAQKASSKSGGSSYNSLSQVAKECETSLQGLIANIQGA